MNDTTVAELQETNRRLNRRAQFAERELNRLRVRLEKSANAMQVASRRLEVNATWFRSAMKAEAKHWGKTTCLLCRARMQIKMWRQRRRWNAYRRANATAEYDSKKAEEFVAWHRNNLDRRIDALRHELAKLELERAKKSLESEGAN